ncbi:hypothetical protein [Paractinoplanes maris]|uniref:hypothetical protein n=1 Tax=Paractinoplanes maris TaxID=1734446 RepID=UPI0020221FF2|nr:hypothetical protein [Actinoplanes maris]
MVLVAEPGRLGRAVGPGRSAGGTVAVRPMRRVSAPGVTAPRIRVTVAGGRGSPETSVALWAHQNFRARTNRVADAVPGPGEEPPPGRPRRERLSRAARAATSPAAALRDAAVRVRLPLGRPTGRVRLAPGRETRADAVKAASAGVARVALVVLIRTVPVGVGLAVVSRVASVGVGPAALVVVSKAVPGAGCLAVLVVVSRPVPVDVGLAVPGCRDTPAVFR